MTKKSSPKKLKSSIKSDPDQWTKHLIEPATLEAFFQECTETLGKDQSLETLQNMAAGVIGDLENIWADIEQDQPQYACRKGCSWCCHQNVTVTVPELLHILAYIRDGLDETARKNLKARVQDRAREIAGKTTNERFDGHIACGFLDGDICSIHKARPLQCRGGFSEDESYCKSLLENREATQQSVKNGDATGKYLLAPKIIYNSAQVAISSALNDAGSDGAAYELTMAMAILLKHSDDGTLDNIGSEELASAFLQKKNDEYVTPSPGGADS